MTKTKNETTKTVNEITTVKGKKANKVPGPKYPFETKSQIQEQLQSDTLFVVECLQILNGRQTSFENETLSTVVKTSPDGCPLTL